MPIDEYTKLLMHGGPIFKITVTLNGELVAELHESSPQVNEILTHFSYVLKHGDTISIKCEEAPQA